MNLLLEPKKAILLNSLVLIIVGFVGYIVKSSPTALIPVFFGIILVLCYMFYDKNSKLIAHIAIGLILLVFLALFMPLTKRFDSQDIYGILRISSMQIISLYSMVCFISSFLKARK